MRERNEMIEDNRRLILQFIHDLGTGTVKDSKNAVLMETAIRKYMEAMKSERPYTLKPGYEPLCMRVIGKRESKLVTMVPMTTASYCLN